MDWHRSGNESEDCGKHRTVSGHHVIGPHTQHSRFDKAANRSVPNTSKNRARTSGTGLAAAPLCPCLGSRQNSSTGNGTDEHRAASQQCAAMNFRHRVLH